MVESTLETQSFLTAVFKVISVFVPVMKSNVCVCVCVILALSN